MIQDNGPAPRDDGDASYQHYLDALPAILSVHNRDSTIAVANDLLRETFGDPGERRCFEILKARKEKCPDCPVEETFRTGKRLKTEGVVVCRDGKELPVMVLTSPVVNGAGEVVRVLKLAADITDFKKLQKKLYRARQRFQQFFDRVPCYVSVQNRGLQLVAANRRFTRDFGEAVGDPCYSVYKHRSEPCLECPVVRTFEDGQSHESEEMVTSMSGDLYNVLVQTAPIRDEHGRITHVVEMSTNITPLRELQSQLESTGLLIGSISHSIKGLLTGLDGGMYLVNSGLKKDDRKRVKKGWEMVTRNVDSIRNTVLNILYYAKEREPSWEKISARELADAVYLNTEAKANEHSVALELAVDDSAGTFEGDPNAVRSMLINLMENALDACRVDKKKTEHSVRLCARGDAEEVQFEVSDNGIGMDQESRERVFSLFFSSKGTEGTGLGLFIANSIAKAHGGGIVVESELDKGTHFVVRMSRKRAVEQSQASDR